MTVEQWDLLTAGVGRDRDAGIDSPPMASSQGTQPPIDPLLQHESTVYIELRGAADPHRIGERAPRRLPWLPASTRNAAARRDIDGSA